MSTPITTKPSSIAIRLKSFGVVHAALTIHSAEAVDELGRRKATALAAGQPADEPTLQVTEDTSYRELFAQLGGELQNAKAEMISANTAHLGQLARIVDLKGRRDGLTGALSGRFFKARHTYETLYGSDLRFPVLAISGDTPTDPMGLVAQVRDTAGFLEDPKVATPELDLLGVDLDPQTTASQLAAGADELEGVLVDVNQAEKQADVTREAKNTAIKAYDDKFLRVARVAESIFQFAGLHELATRVRPSTRRPGRRLADEGASTDPAAQARADAAGADTAGADVARDVTAEPDAPATLERADATPTDVPAEPEAPAVDG